MSEEATRSGPPPLFTQEEEAHLTVHLKFTASAGYGFSRYVCVFNWPEYYCIFISKTFLYRCMFFFTDIVNESQSEIPDIC